MPPSRIRHFLILMSLLSVVEAASQILLIRRDYAPADSIGYAGNLSFFFEVNNREPLFSDRISYFGLDFGTQHSIVTEKHGYFLRLGVDYFRVTGDPLMSTGFVHLRSNWLRSRRLSYETYVQSQYDALRQLEVRAVGGANIKWALIVPTETRRLYLGVGPMYEYEVWTSFETGEAVQVDYLKLNSFVKYFRALSDFVDLGIVTHYQVGFDQELSLWRNRVMFEGELDFAINQKLSFIASWSMQYENNPIIDINKSVYLFINGLRYRF